MTRDEFRESLKNRDLIERSGLVMRLIKGEPSGAGNTATALTTAQPFSGKGHVMAKGGSTDRNPSLQPREDRQDVASQYLVEVICRRVLMRPSGCWCFCGHKSEDGYGIMEVRGKFHRIHRLIYEYCVADIPDGLLVLHHCDNPPCCNPAHLYVGDRRDNAIDYLTRGHHPGVVLSAELVLEIRRLGAAGWRTAHLAKKFGVTIGSVQDVLGRRKWNHVREEP